MQRFLQIARTTALSLAARAVEQVLLQSWNPACRPPQHSPSFVSSGLPLHGWSSKLPNWPWRPTCCAWGHIAPKEAGAEVPVALQAQTLQRTHRARGTSSVAGAPSLVLFPSTMKQKAHQARTLSTCHATHVVDVELEQRSCGAEPRGPSRRVQILPWWGTDTDQRVSSLH